MSVQHLSVQPSTAQNQNTDRKSLEAFLFNYHSSNQDQLSSFNAHSLSNCAVLSVPVYGCVSTHIWQHISAYMQA